MNKDVTVLMDDEGKIQGKGYLKKPQVRYYLKMAYFKYEIYCCFKN